MHAAIAENKILNVQFDWIKYVVHYKKPRRYTGIMIKRNREWSQTVLRAEQIVLCNVSIFKDDVSMLM